MTKGSGHIFSEIYLHLNWHCHSDEPMIIPTVETPLYQFLQEYCRKTKGTRFEGVGGTDTHVHMLFQMEPFVTLSDFVGAIKGASSHDINKTLCSGTIKWQRGYGVVSFAKHQLPLLLRYVRNQKRHHARGTCNATLERHQMYYEDES